MDHAYSGKCKTIPFYYYADNTLKDRNLYSRFQSVLGEAKSLHYCQRIEISFNFRYGKIIVFWTIKKKYH